MALLLASIHYHAFNTYQHGLLAKNKYYLLFSDPSQNEINPEAGPSAGASTSETSSGFSTFEIGNTLLHIFFLYCYNAKFYVYGT